MNNELKTRYPLIFPDKCEISTGPGWFRILDALCATIQCHIENNRHQLQANQKYNEMVAELQQGNDAPFLAYFSSWPENSDYVRERRQSILVEGPRQLAPECPQVVARQIKEKFGGLRFYYDGGDDVVHGAVMMAEAWANVTCDQCGERGESNNTGGWIATRCEIHRKNN